MIVYVFQALQDETVQLQDCVELLTSEKAAAHARVDDLQNQMKQMEKKHKAAVWHYLSLTILYKLSLPLLAQMKDLKKQLIIETKRADRLQEKMLESAVVEADFSFNRGK